MRAVARRIPQRPGTAPGALLFWLGNDGMSDLHHVPDLYFTGYFEDGPSRGRTIIIDKPLPELIVPVYEEKQIHHYKLARQNGQALIYRFDWSSDLRMYC
jgi:hypothetical protein